jgi:L-alanine-DL-glutamate epimerase-like enolase superfamily enzyme
MQIRWTKKTYPLKKPFVITGHVFNATETIEVTISDGVFTGMGEAIGTYYLDETVDSMAADLEAIRPQLDKGLNQQVIQEILPASGARNALDCAYWDFICKSQASSIWQRLNITPNKLTTVFTLGMDEPEVMAQWAREAHQYPHLKIKLNNDRPVERLEAIREARPDANLVVDVNQGWTINELREYTPHCERLGVAMIEQPLPRGFDHDLAGFKSRVPIGADESCLSLSEFASIPGKYDVLNIKLDKCGGLTEGLQLVAAAKTHKMQVMVGNMTGTSLSMAPSYVIGQSCTFVDIDGPLLLARDIKNGLIYRDGGLVDLPTPTLWG